MDTANLPSGWDKTHGKTWFGVSFVGAPTIEDARSAGAAKALDFLWPRRRAVALTAERRAFGLVAPASWPQSAADPLVSEWAAYDAAARAAALKVKKPIREDVSDWRLPGLDEEESLLAKNCSSYLRGVPETQDADLLPLSTANSHSLKIGIMRWV